MVKSKKITKTIVKKKIVKVAPVKKITKPKDEAKEIIAYLLAKLDGVTGKGIERAKNFIA